MAKKKPKTKKNNEENGHFLYLGLVYYTNRITAAE